MSNLDVSMRLRLLYQSREAKAAKKDLKEIDSAAKKLGRANAGDKLGRDLKQVSTNAKTSKRAINELEADARKLNRVKTDGLEKDLRRLGASAKAAAKDFDAARLKLEKMGNVKSQPLEKMVKPSAELNGNMGLLAGSASRALGALGAFVTADNIVRGLESYATKFRELNRAITDVAITAEMRTPEAVAKIGKSNETLSLRYGRSQGEVNDARQAYAATGIGLDSQEQILDPTMKVASTYRNTDGRMIADTVIAAKQNLRINDADVPAALDMMAKGAKLGSFEVKDMAKNFPELGAYMQGAGRTGLKGWAELVTMSQIARFSAGTPDQAADNLRNWLAKLSSKDTVKNFAEKDVDLEKVKEKAEKEGRSYPMAVMDEVMRLTKGNEFRVGELFGDQQAYLALKPLIENRQLYNDWLNQITNQSAGTVDLDAPFARNTQFEKKARATAAIDAQGLKAGQVWSTGTLPMLEKFARIINPQFDRQMRAEEAPADLANNALQRLDIENELLRLKGMQRDMGGGGQALGPQLDRLKAQLLDLEEEQRAILEYLPTKPDNGDLGKSTGKIPVPLERPIANPLGENMGSAADKAMEGYNKNLSAQTEKSVSIVQDAVSAIKAILNFTASPTIVPKVSTPAAPAAPSGGGEKHSSIVNNTGVRLSQNIRSNNPRQAARLAARESERAIQRAMGNSFHDTGLRLT